ncbi:hypothetical protein [Streptomyces roseoverticillatus]|uniref:Transposase n=1 Tax=Streptomyces roseoverticillatus TaxID=66429 RepID=A0ABV3J5Y5_9ACTN
MHIAARLSTVLGRPDWRRRRRRERNDGWMFIALGVEVASTK